MIKQCQCDDALDMRDKRKVELAQCMYYYVMSVAFGIYVTGDNVRDLMLRY